MFWVDEHGHPIRGPSGRYGGPNRIKAAAIVLIPVALMTLVLLNPLSSNDSASTTPPVATGTEAPVQRSEKPTLQGLRTPTSSASVVYKNCAEVRAAGKAPLPRGTPGYSRALDRNGDGIACGHGDF